MTVKEHLFRHWQLTRNIIIQLGIDPDKHWDSITQQEMIIVAQYIGIEPQELNP